jgi:hypothetical protein
MKNLSLLFSILSFTIFLFAAVVSFITKDQQVIRFGFLTCILFLIITTIFNALALESTESQLEEKHRRESDEDKIWDRFDDLDRSIFDHTAAINRNFDDRLDSIWNEIERLNTKCETPKRK